MALSEYPSAIVPLQSDQWAIGLVGFSGKFLRRCSTDRKSGTCHHSHPVISGMAKLREAHGPQCGLEIGEGALRLGDRDLRELPESLAMTHTICRARNCVPRQIFRAHAPRTYTHAQTQPASGVSSTWRH